MNFFYSVDEQKKCTAFLGATMLYFLFSVVKEIKMILRLFLVIAMYTVAVYSWSIANNFVIGVYFRCLEILSQIAFKYSNPGGDQHFWSFLVILT